MTQFPANDLWQNEWNLTSNTQCSNHNAQSNAIRHTHSPTLPTQHTLPKSKQKQNCVRARFARKWLYLPLSSHIEWVHWRRRWLSTALWATHGQQIVDILWICRCIMNMNTDTVCTVRPLFLDLFLIYSHRHTESVTRRCHYSRNLLNTHTLCTIMHNNNNWIVTHWTQTRNSWVYCWAEWMQNKFQNIL